jgi:FKBP-type peptidyl-prolyl cis-trans isomerase
MALVCGTLLLAGCGGGDSSVSGSTSESPDAVAERAEPTVKPPKTLPKKLVVKDLIEGSGRSAGEGDRLKVMYAAIRSGGMPFYSSWEAGEPLTFQLGSNDPGLNPAFEDGLRGMRAGGRREVILPSAVLHPEGDVVPAKRREDSYVYVFDLLAVE